MEELIVIIKAIILIVTKTFVLKYKDAVKLHIDKSIIAWVHPPIK